MLNLSLALGKMEELLLEMKQDMSKLSVELVKCPSVSHQLKIDELSILGKLASRERTSVKPDQLTSQPQSVITQSKVGNSALSTAVTSKSTNRPSSHSTTTSTSLQLTGMPQISATKSETSYALSVPTQYVDSAGTVLMPAQTVSVVPGQQVVYFAPQQVAVVQSGAQTPAVLAPVSQTGATVPYTLSQGKPNQKTKLSVITLE